MRRAMNIASKLQWLGLIGLLGDITGNDYLRLFWLWFLLGFIEIFGNLPAFYQSVQQLLSYPVILLRHRFRLPSKANYTSTTDYALPFAGQWYVANGGLDKKSSHSWGVWPQRYAYDFVMIDENGRTFCGSGKNLQDYFCYGKEVIAPADGEIVSLANGHPESRVYGDGSAECRAKDIRGNHVTIKHQGREVSTVAHLIPGSITVALGQKVVRGQMIARCGNSGNTSEPHIHFQLNDGRSFFASAGLPIRFGNVLAKAAERAYPADYIVKGESVENGLS